MYVCMCIYICMYVYIYISQVNLIDTNPASVVGLRSTLTEGFFALELCQVQLSLEGIQIVSDFPPSRVKMFMISSQLISM